MCSQDNVVDIRTRRPIQVPGRLREAVVPAKTFLRRGAKRRQAGRKGDRLGTARPISAAESAVRRGRGVEVDRKEVQDRLESGHPSRSPSCAPVRCFRERPAEREGCNDAAPPARK